MWVTKIIAKYKNQNFKTKHVAEDFENDSSQQLFRVYLYFTYLDLQQFGANGAY